MRTLRMTLILACALVLPTQVRAGDVVLSVEAGLAFMGPAGLSDVGPLKRDELASAKVQGVSIGYQTALYGGRIRGLFGYDDLKGTDGDWGHQTSDGTIVRQIMDFQSSGVTFGVEYDVKQVKLGDIYPFVGAGVRLQFNKPTHHSAIISYPNGTQSGCVADDAETWAFGWHALAGLGTDFGNWTGRVFYQYTDRGYAKVSDGGSCPHFNGLPLEPRRSIKLTDHDIRLRVSYSF